MSLYKISEDLMLDDRVLEFTVQKRNDFTVFLSLINGKKVAGVGETITNACIAAQIELNAACSQAPKAVTVKKTGKSPRTLAQKNKHFAAINGRRPDAT